MSYKPSVAVIGSAGFIGGPLVEAFSRPDLKDKIQFPVKVLTRSAKDKTSTSTIKYVEAELSESNVAKVVGELKGSDVIVSLLPPSPDTISVLESTLKQVKPKVYIPSQFGSDIRPAQKNLPGFLKIKIDHSDNGHFLTEIVGHVGIDANTKTVTYAGSPQTKIAISYLPDVGNAVASLTSIEPSKLPDTVRIQSDEVTYEDIAKKYEKDHGVTLQVKNITAEELLKKANDRIQTAKEFSLEDFLLYLWAVSVGGRDYGNSYSKNDDDLVNPGGKLFKWTKFH
ncbi:hypothetical protein QCA50_018340 [Cerrena zonata]|uniref:NmrA-like domain-containing protein n=1 Tax=Cerrena zonata TaxID=2478898 RepID=A0AAW0FH40_9APHY